MTKEDFISNVVDEGWVWSEGDYEGTPGIFVSWKECPNEGEVVHCADEAIENNSWQKLRKFVIGGREVYGYSRVVGYYSRTTNWNPSKIGELRDRGVGNYSLPTP